MSFHLQGITRPHFSLYLIAIAHFALVARFLTSSYTTFDIKTPFIRHAFFDTA
jgi:hypothetical protein